MSTIRKKTKNNYNKAKKLLSLYSYNTPNIVIVGDNKIRRKIGNFEKNFNLVLIFSKPEKLKDYINSKTVAIIVDEKSAKLRLKEYLSKLLYEYRMLPIFFLSRSQKSSNFYKTLYERGLQGAINWPQESSILHNLIIESLKPHPKAIGITKGDEKLSEIVKSHLVLYGDYKRIRVKVIEGFVFLEGSVKSLYDKELIENESSKVLGVKKAIVKDIKIKKSSRITDRELERKMKMYMGHVLESKKRSMSVKVKEKVVTIMGACSSYGDVLDIESFAMKQPGVQKIVRLVKYKPSLVSKNVKKAKFLEEKVKDLFIGVKHISISIYGEFAEVSGTVKVSADRYLVEKYLLQVLPVKRVVNKLFVSQRN